MIIVMVRKKRKWWCFIFGDFLELYFDEDGDDDDADDDDDDDQEPEVVAEIPASHEFKQEAHWLSHCANLQIPMIDKDYDGYDHD